MSNAPFARSTIAPPSWGEDDYDAIFATLMGSARGRWFLNEFARRNRHADTTQVIAAISRIETLISDRESETARNLRADLLDMARAITEVRSEVVEIKPPDVSVDPAVRGEHPVEFTAAAVAPRADQQDTNHDPLAALKALSDEERIALCT